MKPWKPLLALCCILSTAAVAHASVLFRGLQYSPVGSSVVDVGADGRLSVSNLGSSGQDGVSIWSPRSNGMRLALDGACSSADEGASATLAYHWSILSRPQGSQAALASARVAVSGGALQCGCDLSQLSSAQTLTVSLYRGGKKLFVTGLGRYEFAVVATDNTGLHSNPAIALYLRKEGTTISGKSLVLHARFSFPLSAPVTLAGQTVDADEIEFSAAVDPEDEDCDGVSADLRVVAPPGSSLSHVRCSDGSCRLYDQWVCATGAATLDLDAFAAPPPGAAVRRLPVHNLGSSGQDGVEIKRSQRAPFDGSALPIGDPDSDADGVACALRFAAPGLVFDPRVDEGASDVLTITGAGFDASGASLGQYSRSFPILVHQGRLVITPSHTGASLDQEWVKIMDHGVEVARFTLQPGGAVGVQPPPGMPVPLGMAINEKGLPDRSTAEIEKRNKGNKLPATAAQPASSDAVQLSASRGIAVDIRMFVHAIFVPGCRFDWPGGSASGDMLVSWSDASSGALDGGSFVAQSMGERVACPNPASSLSSLQLLDLERSLPDVIGATVGSSSISTAHSCVSIPFEFTRSDSTPVRAYSVTFHLSPELAACGAGITEGNYLSRVAGTQMFVTDNGSGSYTVDCGILGPVCGATGSGVLFSLQLGAAPGVTSGTGAIVIDSASVRDCSNQPVPADGNATSYLPIQLAAPPAQTGLTATQVKSGNPQPSSTTGIRLAGLTGSATTGVALYRKPFGNYPLYSRGSSPGSVPSPPASSSDALAHGWSPVTCSSGACTSVSCSGGACLASVLDSPPSRDFLYYVAFARDLYGNESPVSNMTPGTLDYFLGDVSDGASTCTGDDQVDIADISALGSHYGASVASFPSLACLDVGPTTDYSVDARPTVDGKFGFEDFVMFAINFSVVSSPRLSARPMAMATDAVRLTVPATLPEVGSTFDASVLVDGAGDAQALSVRLDYDHAVLEQVGVANGSLLDAQGRAGLVLSSGPGSVDAALLGAGPGIAGSGELARVTFRVLSGGEAKLAIAGVSARDVANHPVPVAGVDAGAVADARTGLGFLFPNPFQQAVEIRLSLRRDGPAKLAVYDVAGRRVRMLLDGVQPAGGRTVTWDGNDDGGLRMAPGAYVVRLEAAGRNETRTVRLVR